MRKGSKVRASVAVVGSFSSQIPGAMGDVIKAFAQARESAFFKQEQEADLQRHRSRLVKSGKIEDTAGANLRPRRQKTFEESIHAFEMLPEVLQQQARLDDPGAAARQEFIRKIRGMPTQLTEAEMRQYRSTVYGVAAAVGHIPRMGFGRYRYHLAASAQASAPPPPVQVGRVPIEVLEASRRAYTAGVRSLVYGSLLGAFGVAVTATAAAQVMGIQSGADIRFRAQEAAEPIAAAMKGYLIPFKERLQQFGASLGPEASAAEGATVRREETAEFARRLSSKYNPRYQGEPTDTVLVRLDRL
ncbi:hypothetical protein WJX72_002241 [[Myrmecia] bisecta]|uniref:Uncharacterized protein n=1 Tax=[Myrmecia] bisecta TaxID=41462 RepID=A0AAW1PU11_9CHLO